MVRASASALHPTDGGARARTAKAPRDHTAMEAGVADPSHPMRLDVLMGHAYQPRACYPGPLSQPIEISFHFSTSTLSSLRRASPTTMQNMSQNRAPNFSRSFAV